ncbi:MAG: AbrB/MazE/SpoVT family DNA-binding domain-containing protein [Candidatus Hydrogenedentes bacterium]|nr:AbrB/MazE/SpoVT family DNA-binding domain-containing protein [Candidatus Hydrogenedentota bacterium]
METTITKIGDSFGIILPPDFLERLQLKDGDKVYLTESPDGVRISPHDADFELAMTHAERVMRENDNALRRLAE